MRTCYRTGTTTRVDAFATLTLDPATNTWGNPVVWCPQDTTPGPDPTALREQAIRLLPTVGIGTAPRADSLVNIETILWADTTATRDLGTVTVTGIEVHLRARVRHVTWTFGDHTGDTTTDPGTAYTQAHPCRTATCPGYYGHTYRATGTDTLTATITWHAQYQLAGGAWTDIPTDLNGPTASTTLTVHQARSVLVPN
jgi:hypothetical protein